MIKILNKILHIIQSCYLCIRFPFLYPRNRYNDLHYNNYIILNKINEYLLHSKISFTIKIYDSKSEKYLSDKKSYDNFIVDAFPIFYLYGNKYSLKYNSDIINIYLNNNIIYSININDYIKSGIFKRCEFIIKYNIKTSISCDLSYTTQVYIALIGDQLEYNDNIPLKKYFISFNVNKFYLYKYKLLKFIHNKLLQYIYIIPTYTELDSMPIGWRKSFGIQICKEIKKELKKYKYLYKYRITQIKEKFGTLRWYDNGYPNKCLDKIINKYENISCHTCINCGNKAKYISKGWISPYCENCISDNNNYNLINERK